ncbi:YciE/YciF ferroxidase family protein [Tellurirhabdus rosea]|uniref:YciE/YciF ferroxidase family protein n=1 Tax=Tellurirhabdus rosea TaxID=2674997 RepID=UPI002258815B|nr:ferritin-like domain-containing protein [Tellurirhabdus rosea]
MKTVNELLEHELQDLYSAETQALEAYPTLIESAQDQQLKKAFEMHMKQTQKQVERLEKACELMGCDPEGETCVGIQGLIEETENVLDEVEGEIADAALIGCAQKMEHYEIAAYGTARTLAQQAGMREIADLLEQTLNEEKETDAKLTKIAEGRVNKKAADSK